MQTKNIAYLILFLVQKLGECHSGDPPEAKIRDLINTGSHSQERSDLGIRLHNMTDKAQLDSGPVFTSLRRGKQAGMTIFENNIQLLITI